MEIILSLAIGLMTTCGVWLILRPRTYQVIVGLSLLSYAVNLFIFGVGGAFAFTLRPGVTFTYLGLRTEPCVLNAAQSAWVVQRMAEILSWPWQNLENVVKA